MSSACPRSQPGEGDERDWWQRDTQGARPPCPLFFRDMQGACPPCPLFLRDTQGACLPCPPFFRDTPRSRSGTARVAGTGSTEPLGGRGAAAPPIFPAGKKNPETPLVARWGGKQWNSKGDLVCMGCRGGSAPPCLYKSRRCTGAFPTWKNGSWSCFGKGTCLHSRKVPSAFVLLQVAGKDGNSESSKSTPFPVSFTRFMNVK